MRANRLASAEAADAQSTTTPSQPPARPRATPIDLFSPFQFSISASETPSPTLNMYMDSSSTTNANRNNSSDDIRRSPASASTLLSLPRSPIVGAARVAPPAIPAAQHALWFDPSFTRRNDNPSTSEDSDGLVNPLTRRVHPDFDPLQQGSSRFLCNSLQLSLDTSLGAHPSWAHSARRLSLESPPITPRTATSSHSAQGLLAPLGRTDHAQWSAATGGSAPISPITPPHESLAISHDFSPVVGSPARRSSLPVEAALAASNNDAQSHSHGLGRSDLDTSPTSRRGYDRTAEGQHHFSTAPCTPVGASLLNNTAVDNTSWSWPAPSLAHRYRDGTSSPLDLGALRASLPRFDDSQSSSPTSSPVDASPVPVTRYVQVDAFVAEEARVARLQEVIVRAKEISSYKGWCGVSAQGVVVAFHDVRSASAFVGIVNSLLKSSRVEARCITRNAFEELLDATPMLNRQLLSNSEGVLAITFEGSTLLRDSAVLPLLSSIGSLRYFSTVEPGVFLCEFTDDRGAESARRVLDGREQGGTTLQCSFEPSMTSTSRISDLAAENTEGWPTTSTPAGTELAQPASISPLAPSFVPLQVLPSSVTRQADAQDASDRFAEVGLGRQKSMKAREYGFNESGQSAQETSSVTRSPISTAYTSPSALQLTPPASPTSLPRTHGIYRDERIPRNNVINLERIQQGLDLRTTLMLKNIPNKLKDVDVMRFIDEAVGRCYQFLYVRLDWSSGANVGYGFVDFNSVDNLVRFVRARVGTRWNLANSDKICVASYANIQGKAGLITHFKNSSVLDQNEERRPKLFYSPGHPLAGQPEPFPACDDPVRRARSAANAVSVGLFPAARAKFLVAEARPSQGQ